MMYNNDVQHTLYVPGDDIRNIRHVKPRMWKSAGERCPVSVYSKYVSLRPASMMEPHSPFYIAPNTLLSHADKIPEKNIQWFKSQPIGVNKLSSLMKTMSANAGVKGLTNHSARKHLIQKLTSAGIPPTHIMQISGHRNVASLNNYSRLSMEQKRDISNILAEDDAPVSACVEAQLTLEICHPLIVI